MDHPLAAFLLLRRTLGVTGMLTPDSMNRVAKILMDSGEAASYDRAQAMLERYSVRVSVSAGAARSEAAQAALLTIVVTGTRALPGGVFLDGELNVPIIVGPRPSGTLRDRALALGAKLGHESRPGIPAIRLGATAPQDEGEAPTLDCFLQGWRAGVIPGDSNLPRSQGEAPALAGVLAGALAVSEVFRFHRGGNAEAARLPVGLSLWDLERANWWQDDESEPAIQFLPSALWVIGLGHLGQAYLWALGLLPYAKPEDLLLVLHDFDRLAASNISTSVLTSSQIVGELKTRQIAHWAEAQGFTTRIVEQKFGLNTRVGEEDPRIALCGVDNALARAALGDAGFELVLNAGLGAGPLEFMAMRLYSFPGPKTPRAIWGSAGKKSSLPVHLPAYQALAAAGLDECGVTLLAERTVGAPFVGVSAACLMVAELLRMLHGGRRVLILDATLASLGDRHVVQDEALALRNPGFTPARAA